MIDIDRLLKERRLSKTDLAKRMGLSRESLYRILSGNPTLENIQKLSDAVGVSVSELFEHPQADTITCPQCGAKLKVSKE
jgi:transcriptional regulator with XRE-family HTH domain